MLKRFLLAWRIAAGMPLFSEPVKWTSEDRNWLADVFANDQGRKLKNFLDKTVYDTNKWAVQRPADDIIRACGFAAGVVALTATIENLSRTGAHPGTSEEQAEDAASPLLDQYAA